MANDYIYLIFLCVYIKHRAQKTADFVLKPVSLVFPSAGGRENKKNKYIESLTTKHNIFGH